MATVYQTRDPRHDRKVAIKVLRRELAAVIGAERFVMVPGLRTVRGTAGTVLTVVTGLSLALAAWGWLRPASAPQEPQPLPR